jgi:hypothetical protein
MLLHSLLLCLQEYVDLSTGSSRSIPEAAEGSAQPDTPAWMLDAQREQQLDEAEDDEEDEEEYEPFAQPAAAAAARTQRQVGREMWQQLLLCGLSCLLTVAWVGLHCFACKQTLRQLWPYFVTTVITHMLWRIRHTHATCPATFLHSVLTFLQGRSKAADDDEEDIEASLLADMGNEDDWGLEGLIPRSSSSSSAAARQQQRRGRRSLLDELEAEELAADGFEEGSLAASNNASVQWGGSAGFTGIDLEEQEEMLRRYFKPQEVQKLMKEQEEIDASYSELRVSTWCMLLV